MQPLYRDTLEAVRADLAVARARRTATIEIAGQLVPVLAGRWARVIFGATLILGAAAMGVAALANPAMGTLTVILSGSLALALGLRLATTPLIVQALRHRIRSLTARDPAGARPGFTQADPQSALEALRTEPCPGAAFVSRTARWESAGLTLPLAGLCLILPLSIHLMIWAGIVGIAHAAATTPDLPSYWSMVALFDQWIRASAVLVGLAHLVLVLSVLRYVAALRRTVLADCPSSFTPLLVAVAGAAFPSAVFIHASALYLLPMVIAFATGIAFIPATLNRAARLFRDERAHIQVVEEALASGPNPRHAAG